MPGITKRLVAKTLAESVFAPHVNGPLRAVTESATVDYLQRRAREFISQNVDVGASSNVDAAENLTIAISLLALAKIKLRGINGKSV